MGFWWNPSPVPATSTANGVSGMASSLWMTSDHDCFHCALHAALSLKHLQTKPVVRKAADGGWRVRYQPRMIMINGAA